MLQELLDNYIEESGQLDTLLKGIVNKLQTLEFQLHEAEEEISWLNSDIAELRRR